MKKKGGLEPPCRELWGKSVLFGALVDPRTDEGNLVLR